VALANVAAMEPTGVLTRTPPHSVDLEQALLGCCILEGGQESITQCIEYKIKPESFYVPAHQLIYRALFDLYEEGKPSNELIVAEKLQSRGQLDVVGGYAYLTEISSRIDTPVHLLHYLKRVRDLELVRRVIKVSIGNIENAYSGNEDVGQFLENAEREIFAISDDRISDSAKHVKHSVEKAINLVGLMLTHKGEITGVTSGFRDLDIMTSGFKSGEVTVIAARPSMGKTTIALNMAEAALLPRTKGGKSTPTLLFSLEMSADQLAMRLLCARARVDMVRLAQGFLPDSASQELNRTASEFRSAPLWIDESANLTILEMRAKARRIDSQQKLGLIIIDYLQLIAGSDARMPREQQIAEISRGIKAMAKELNVPVIVAAQLNRESERERRQPRLSDLRESGSIEQDADIVLLLSRKKEDIEAAKKDSLEKKEIDEDVEYADFVVRDLLVAKHRNGPVGTIRLGFLKNITRFENYTGHP